MDDDKAREMIEWSLGAYTALQALAIFGTMPYDVRRDVERILSEAPDFFKPSAQRYSADNIRKAVRDTI